MIDTSNQIKINVQFCKNLYMFNSKYKMWYNFDPLVEKRFAIIDPIQND